MITIIQCIQTGVMVTMGVTDERRAPAVAMHERVLATLVCPDDASKFASVWPRTNIPADFGVLNGESIILGHRDGRWLLVSAMTPSTVRSVERSHHSALQMFASLGNVVGFALNPIATASPGRTLSGRASVWLMEPSSMGAMVATTFVCIDEGIAYLILAGDDSHESDHSELEALSLRFACPEGRTRPLITGDVTPLLERPGVCEVGAEEFCNTLADAD